MMTDNATGRGCFVATCNVSRGFCVRSKKEPSGDEGLKPGETESGVSHAGRCGTKAGRSGKRR